MKRNDSLNSKENPQSATISFSPKGDLYISPKSDEFPYQKGVHQLPLIDEINFFFIQDRFFMYGISPKNTGNYYSTSYNRASDLVTLYEKSGDNQKQLAKDTPTNLKRDYKLSTGVLLTVAFKENNNYYCVDLKFQASSRGEWIDFLNQCRRDRMFPDFSIVAIDDEKFGKVYQFKRHGIEPEPKLQSFIEGIENEI